MGSAVNLQGNIIAGPQSSSGTVFPAGFVNVQFGLTPPNKDASVQVYEQVNLKSSNAYVTLPGVGASSMVTKGTFLFLRTTMPMSVRVTTDDGSGGSVTSVVPVQGLCIMEFPSQNFLKLLEAEGVGVIEFFASGNQ